VLDAPQPVSGIWDAERLDQVLTNLISNALKYSPDGGEVRVAMTSCNEQVTIRVSDQGIGMSAEDLARVF
jgi:signal transduction histidine kinase